LLTGGRKKKKEKKELQINTQGEGRDKPGKRKEQKETHRCFRAARRNKYHGTDVWVLPVWRTRKELKKL
jgi:hypothetical protein